MKQVVRLGSRIIRRGYALLFAFVFIFYIGMALLPARLMLNGHATAAAVVYKGFHFLCHQYPWRSWYLGGEQPYYPLKGEPGIKSIEEASGMALAEIHPRAFYGIPGMGYKMAVCQRDTAIYAAMGLFSLIFFLSRNRIRRVDWKLWLIIGVLPMAADGLWQVASRLIPVLTARESTPFLRTLTGALFGFLTCWYLLPTLEQTLRSES